MLHLTDNNALFPQKLKKIHTPPHELFMEGDWEALAGKPMLAVIGSRKPTPYGRMVTEKLVKSCVAYGIVVVSGLALGIDSIAHKATIDGGGRTIAILPAGLNNIVPVSHTWLAKEIIKSGGALISEFPPHTKASITIKASLIARNRLVAALADTVLITEATEKSGTLHTANFALELGKDILSVPGPITSPMSKGCNNLIKSGATPVTDYPDILNALGIVSPSYTEEITAGSEAEARILNLIQQGTHDGEELQLKSQIEPAEFLRLISLLEISGRIKAIGGGQWTLI